MMRSVTTTDGVKVVVSPMATDGHPDYGGEELRDARWLHRQRHAYQDRILKVINDNDLWQYMDEPGRMSAEYRSIRKRDPEMVQLVRCVKASTMGKLPGPRDPAYKDVVPEDWLAWPFPGRIMEHQSVDNADWVIDQEMQEVYVFVLTNTNENPLDPKGKLFKTLAPLSDVERSRATNASKVKLYRGERKNKIIITAGCSCPFTLFDDPEIPRHYPNTKLERYDHTNPRHNPELRTDGVFGNMHAYVGDKAPEATVARKVMGSVEE